MWILTGMMWILTGMLLGSIITSAHDTEELCQGRRAMLTKIKEVNVIASCHYQPNSLVSGIATGITTTYIGPTSGYPK